MIIKALLILLGLLAVSIIWSAVVVSKRADEQHEKQRLICSFSTKIYKNSFDLDEDEEDA